MASAKPAAPRRTGRSPSAAPPRRTSSSGSAPRATAAAAGASARPARPAAPGARPAPPPPPSPAFLRRFFKRDRFAARAGIRLREVRPGYALATMPIRPHHLNGVDVVQGGAVFTLADLTFAVACNTLGPVALAIDVSISFLAATTGGTLTAEAREVSRSSRLSRVEVEVRDDQGARVALFHGTAYVTRDSLEAAAARPRRTTRS
ncbi:MAG: PaaI family thioesterase [Anaeromyxobacter sp.]|nr:PaaI family thioesterase [Anaeromyxobacter sp.]